MYHKNKMTIIECCVCLEPISYYSYQMNCKHDLCEKCAYKMFDANSKKRSIIEKHRNVCFLSCPMCRTESILKIQNRYVYYFDNIINLSSIHETMEYIHNLYNSKADIETIPYIMIMYPDGVAYILDPKTKLIYSAYNEKYRIGRMNSRRIINKDNEITLQTWLKYDSYLYIYIRDFITCKTNRLNF
jgi:hypothetical protein